MTVSLGMLGGMEKHHSHMEGMELRSVGNSRTLKDSALVEAFNLKVSWVWMYVNHPLIKGKGLL